jgi:hypothetical protein
MFGIQKGLMKMTMTLKFNDVAADGVFTDIVWKILNPDAGGSVLKESAAVSAGAYGRLVEQDALSEMLEEMSLSTLLYYVLAGDGKITDEPA